MVCFQTSMLPTLAGMGDYQECAGAGDVQLRHRESSRRWAHCSQECNTVAARDMERRLKVEVARRYYLENKTQDRIARELGLSRIKVQRLLAQCRREGIVEIRIKDPLLHCLELENALREKFSLEDVLVINSPSVPSLLTRNLARAGAEYFAERVSEGCVIGAAWGRTVFEMVQFLEPRPVKGVKVVSLIGGLTVSLAHNPYTIINRIGDVFGAEIYYLSAPAIADSPRTREVFMGEKRIQEMLRMAQNADLAVIGIGDVTDESTLVLTGYLTPRELAELRDRGAVGEILASHFDIEGRLVESHLSERLVGLRPPELQSIGKVIALAGGEKKVESIRGALRGHYVDVLVTDEDTARALAMEEHPATALPERDRRVVEVEISGAGANA
ncbi:MAG TPA: sugar-binding transcriptional regulator [Firmicutes bacterium]|nr:sugar-binding transcriptional regulator [Bacillota bacterium]